MVNPVLGDLEVDLLVGLGQGGEVVGQEPPHPGEDGRGRRHDDHPQDERQKRIGSGLLPALFLTSDLVLGRGALLGTLGVLRTLRRLPVRGQTVREGAVGLGPALPPDLPGVPAGGVVSVFPVHGAMSSLVKSKSKKIFSAKLHFPLSNIGWFSKRQVR